MTFLLEVEKTGPINISKSGRKCVISKFIKCSNFKSNILVKFKYNTFLAAFDKRKIIIESEF